MISSGKLRHKVTILEPSTPALTGDPIVSYSDVKEVNAEVLPLNARKIAIFRQSDFKATHSVRFRYPSFPGLTEKHQISFNGIQYAIETMTNEDNENETWALTVVAYSTRGNHV